MVGFDLGLSHMGVFREDSYWQTFTFALELNEGDFGILDTVLETGSPPTNQVETKSLLHQVHGLFPKLYFDINHHFYDLTSITRQLGGIYRKYQSRCSVHRPSLYPDSFQEYSHSTEGSPLAVFAVNQQESQFQGWKLDPWRSTLAVPWETVQYDDEGIRLRSVAE